MIRAMEALTGSLELREAQGRLRFFLDGRMVSGGSTLELCFSGGWVVGRFEWSGDPSEAPRFHASIELAAGGVVEHCIALPDGAHLRWP